MPDVAPEPEPEAAVPPSVLAAQRSGSAVRRRGTGRAYPLIADYNDVDALQAELAATQAILMAESAEQVAAVVSTFVRDLGGSLVPASCADPKMTIPVDVSMGLSEPLLPCAESLSVAAMRLNAALPRFLEGARQVLSRLQGDLQRDNEATRDPLTGLLTRRAWMRRLSMAVSGDSVCLVDLDHFKAVNDAGGHGAGDHVLREVGGLLLRSFREGDSCGRYGGDELVCLTPGLRAPDLVARCDLLRRNWERERPDAGGAVGLSIGVAQVGVEGGRAALRAADRAMYRGKAAGRNHTVLALLDDYESGTTA